MTLTEAQAGQVVAAARREAATIDVPMNIAVLDAGARLKAFLRMDGALLGSTDIALGKAKTAALFGLSTEIVGEFAKPGGTSPGLELTNGGLVIFAGGIPLRGTDGELIGAIGVSGGSVAQDLRVAQTGAAAFGPDQETSRSNAEVNRSIIAAGLQAWADGTGSPYDLLADEVRWTIAGNSVASRLYPSKEAFLDEVIRPFNARMRSPLVPTVHRLYADGDSVVAHFDARGVARDGVPYLNSYAWILRMAGGKIIEATAFFDAIAFDDFWARVSPEIAEAA
jgi:uncharacterized protein GlcG (DUF336 family)/ketosteroid isomerase-like protein